MTELSPEEQQRIADYSSTLDPSKATVEQTRKALVEAIGDRALALYFTKQVLDELYPEVDSEEVLARACRRFGEYKAQSFHDVENAADFLQTLTSYGGFLAWDQEVTHLSEDHAEKLSRTCPHIEALRQLGLSEDEVDAFCERILMNADYGMVSGYDHLRLEFPNILGRGDDTCTMCVRSNR